MATETKRKTSTKHEVEQIPDIMHAAAIDRFGPPEVLTIHKLPVPELEHGEVLIEVDTAGVGSWDAEMRKGWSPNGQTKFPLVLGTDGAGRVAALGSHIRRFKLGDQVYAYSFNNPKGGFYAEYVAVNADNVAPVPKGLSLREAGAIGTTGLTALQGIDDALKIRRGESLIIHGGSGGVGTLAVQFAKLREARVLATAAGEDGVALMFRLGAHQAVDGKNGDIATAARSFAPEGVDAVLGLAGGDALHRCIEAIKPGGRLAYPNGVEPEPRKKSGVAVIPYDATPGVRQFEALNMAAEAAKLQVVIAAVYPLGDAAKAHESIEKRHVLGKIVLRTR